MPLPELHLESLERLLRIHDEELVALHTSLQAFTREIDRRETAYPGRVGDEGRDPNAKVGGIPILISQREVIEQKIRVHEVLIALAREQRYLDTLGELLGNPDLAREAARDPTSFAEDRGIEIPANLALELYIDEDQVSLRITHYDEFVPFVAIWNESGFSVPRLELRQAAESGAEPSTGNA
jgi:hypothetical protein